MKIVTKVLVITAVASFVLGFTGSTAHAVFLAPFDTVSCGTVLPPYNRSSGEQTNPNTYDISATLNDPTAGNAMDHKWVQLLMDKPKDGWLYTTVTWDMGIATDRAYLIPAIDHGFVIDPNKEAREATLYGSGNRTGPWEMGTETAVFPEGPTDWVSDDFSTLWTFSKPYRYIFSEAGGTQLNDLDAEIDAVCAPPRTPPTPTANLDIRKLDSDDLWGDTVSITAEERVELRWTSTNATRCVSDVSAYFITGASSPANGTQKIVNEPASGSRTYSVTCYNGPGDGDPSTTSAVRVTVARTTTNLHFLQRQCPSWSVLKGNEIADQVDATGGNYTQFTNFPTFPVYAPPSITPSEIPSSCTPLAGWRFTLATDLAQTQNVSTVGPTNASGEFVVPVSGLTASQRDALDNGEFLYASAIGQPPYHFAVARCHDDAIYGDTVDAIMPAPDGDLPDDVYCLFYHVIIGDPEISANPILVDYGTSSTVSWVRNGHTGCSVTRAGDTISGDTDGSVATTGPLYGETTYTITCTDTGASDSVTVRVRPRLEEI